MWFFWMLKWMPVVVGSFQSAPVYLCESCTCAGLSPNCCVQSCALLWHMLVCGPKKQQNFVCFPGDLLLCQECAIMWQCTCKRERW